MKKINLITILIIVSLLLLKCVSQKKVGYDFPVQMLDYVKVEYEKQCDKGQVFYNMSCAKCHNKIIKGKKIIPDFNTDQIVAYTLRISNDRHKVALEDTILSTEELGLIMTFLTYKKKSGVPMEPKK